MKIQEVPDQYKVFVVKLSNGERFSLTGAQKEAMINSHTNLVELPNNRGFNKNFVVSWSIDVEETRENVMRHQKEIENALVKTD